MTLIKAACHQCPSKPYQRSNMHTRALQMEPLSSAFITSTEEVMSACMPACLLKGSDRNYRVDFHRTIWKGVAWPSEETKTSCGRFVSRSRKKCFLHYRWQRSGISEFLSVNRITRKLVTPEWNVRRRHNVKIFRIDQLPQKSLHRQVVCEDFFQRTLGF